MWFPISLLCRACIILCGVLTVCRVEWTFVLSGALIMILAGFFSWVFSKLGVGVGVGLCTILLYAVMLFVHFVLAMCVYITESR